MALCPTLAFRRGAPAWPHADGSIAEPGLFERVVLVWPPMGWQRVITRHGWVPDRTVDPGADVLVIAQPLDRDHPLKLAEQWAEALGARLEVFSGDGLLWDTHRQRFGALLGDFLSGR